jgi:hypothetical protein
LWVYSVSSSCCPKGSRRCHRLWRTKPSEWYLQSVLDGTNEGNTEASKRQGSTHEDDSRNGECQGDPLAINQSLRPPSCLR